MVRALLRLVIVVVLLVAAAAFFFGYRWADGDVDVVPDRPVGTTGEVIDTDRARATGAEIGEKVAIGASTAERAVADASLTTKIKSKMALDDSVKAIDIDVDTRGSVVTLTGRVATEAERAKAVQLAQETDGVTQVVDHLTVMR